MTEESPSTKKPESILSLSVELEGDSPDESILARCRSPTDKIFYSSVSTSEDEGEENICHLCLADPGSCTPQEQEHEEPHEESILSLYMEDTGSDTDDSDTTSTDTSNFSSDSSTDTSDFTSDGSIYTFVSELHILPQLVFWISATTMAPPSHTSPALYTSEMFISIEDQTARKKEALPSPKKIRGNF